MNDWTRFSKVIIGFSEGDRFAVHLHECQYSAYLNEADRTFVVSEGEGPYHLQHTAWPLHRLLYLAALPVYFGHNLVSHPPVDATLFTEGNTKLTPEHEFLAFTIVVVLEEDRLGSSSLWPLGTTMTPLGLHTLNIERDGVPKSPDDCIALSNKAVNWVSNTNKRLWQLQEDNIVEEILRWIVPSDEKDAKIQGGSKLVEFALKCTGVTLPDNAEAIDYADLLSRMAQHRRRHVLSALRPLCPTDDSSEARHTNILSLYRRVAEVQDNRSDSIAAGRSR